MKKPPNEPVDLQLPPNYRTDVFTAQDLKIFNYISNRDIKQRTKLLKAIAGAFECQQLLKKAKL